MKTEFTIGVFGIVFNEKRQVLLCHRRDYNLWNLPGGALEAGESIVDCLVREVKEETGLDVEISRLVGIYNKIDKRDIVFSFVCKAVGGKISLNDEADKIEYFDFKKIPSNISPRLVGRIKDALKDKEQVVFKKQKGKSSIELIKEGKL